jgi:hypothetical protein
MLTLDGDQLPAADWATVIVLNGDLGKDFPLGRGLPFGDRSFRVVALRYRGLRPILGQLRACQTGKVLDDPGRFHALVREVRTLAIRPVGTCPPQMFNLDGLRMMTRGEVRIAVSGRVWLIAGESEPDHHRTPPVPP